MTIKALKRICPSAAEEPRENPELPPIERDEALVALCISTNHSTLAGRVRVRWNTSSGDPKECWVPTLRQVAVREQDRVLLLWAANEAEPIVVGIVDGFGRRAEPARLVGIGLELKDDEVFRVTSEHGESILEVVRSPEGPVVRLLCKDTLLELPGKLRITAAEIELNAERGKVRIEASDDVEIKGEMLRLN